MSSRVITISTAIVVVTSAVVGAACDTPETIIVPPGQLGEGEGEGEGEFVGEGEGEGEGEEPVQATGSCPAIAGARFGDTIAMQVPRSRHTATLLDDGTVLVVGGEDDSYLPTNAVEIIDPVAGTSTTAAALNVGRYEHAAVKLGDGSVVVAGGFGDGHLASIERFDGTSWTTIGRLDAPRSGLSGFALGNGTAVFFGGDTLDAIPTTAVVVDVNGVVASSAQIGPSRRLHGTAQLADGRVLVVGGFAPPAIATTAVIAADGVSAVAGPAMGDARRQTMVAALDDGRAVIMGGIGTDGLLSSIEIFTANGAGFTRGTRLLAPRHSGEALALADCGVVVCGGLGVDGPVDTCEGVDTSGAPIAMTATLPKPTFSFTFTALSSSSSSSSSAAIVVGGSLPEGHIGTAQVLTTR